MKENRFMCLILTKWSVSWFRLCVDSTDLFLSISIQIKSIDRSIIGYVARIRYELQTAEVDEISWIRGKVRITNTLTKKVSVLGETLQITLLTGNISIEKYDVDETKIMNKKLGWKRRSKHFALSHCHIRCELNLMYNRNKHVTCHYVSILSG